MPVSPVWVIVDEGREVSSIALMIVLAAVNSTLPRGFGPAENRLIVAPVAPCLVSSIVDAALPIACVSIRVDRTSFVSAQSVLPAAPTPPSFAYHHQQNHSGEPVGTKILFLYAFP